MWLCVTVCYLPRCFLTWNDSHSRTAPRCCGDMVSNDHRQVWLMFGTHTAVEAIRHRLLCEGMKLLWLLGDGHYLIWKQEVVLEDWYLLILFMLYLQCYWMWQGWIRYRIVLIWEQAIMLLIYIALLLLAIIWRRTVIDVETLKRCGQRCCLLLIHECRFGLTSDSIKTCIILLFITYCGLKSIRCPFWLLFLRPIDRKHVGVNLLLGLILVSCIDITLMMDVVSNGCIKRIWRCLG